MEKAELFFTYFPLLKWFCFAPGQNMPPHSSSSCLFLLCNRFASSAALGTGDWEGKQWDGEQKCNCFSPCGTVYPIWLKCLTSSHSDLWPASFMWHASFLMPEVPSFKIFFKITDLCKWLHWVLVVVCGIFSLRWGMRGSLVAAREIFSWGMWTVSCCMWDLVPWLGIEPGPSPLRAQSLSCWTTRGVPRSTKF